MTQRLPLIDISIDAEHKSLHSLVCHASVRDRNSQSFAMPKTKTLEHWAFICGLKTWLTENLLFSFCTVPSIPGNRDQGTRNKDEGTS